MHKPLALSILAGALLAATSPAALASDTFGFSGTGSTGVSFSGTVTYDLAAAYELSIALTNTTAAGIGGFLTGLAFDLPGAASIGAYTSTHPGMTLASNLSTSPFGSREWGVAVGGDWLGGGNPSGGVAAGANGSWSFDLTGGPDHLSFSDLNLVARFRGLNDGGSDKVPAVPEPETWALMVAGLGVLALVSRRRRGA
jgi:hypothetical protein